MHDRDQTHFALLMIQLVSIYKTPSIRNNAETLFLEDKDKLHDQVIKFLTFYISRNEARVASLNSNWLLVGVFKKDGVHEILGCLSYDQFSGFLPINSHPNGRWENCKNINAGKSFSENLTLIKGYNHAINR